MKKIIQFLIIVFAFNINAKIEVLDRVAVIVDDGVIMELQIKNTILETDIDLVQLYGYTDFSIIEPPLPPSPPSGPPYSINFSLLKLGEPSPPLPALT